MTKIFLLAGITLAAACGSKADNALGDLEGFKDRVCACKDKECADGVKKDMREWKKKMRDEGIKKSELSDDQKKRAKEIDKEMDTCAEKFRESKKMEKPADKPAEAPKAEEKK
jgi:hypothetical protein